MTARCLFLCLAIGIPTISVAAEETYDLRGPGPKKGQVTRDVSKFTMKNADMAVTIGGGVKLEGKMDMVTTTEKEEVVLGVEGRDVTKIRTKLLKDEVKRKTTLGGETEEETEKKALAGEFIFSERVKDKWKHVLEDNTPNDKQKKELKDFDNPENDDELFPKDKVKIGHTWDIDPIAFKKVISSKLSEATGKGKGKFLRLEKIDGEECAVVEMDLDIKGRIKDEDSDFKVEMKGKLISFRALATGLDMKYTIEGTAKFDGKVDEDGQKANLMFSGKMLGEGTSKLVKK
ncbi:MAG: hypothetical protein K8T89_00325 [Planctomycetes bacterium]|nr:hypothetical protein [Planctomycetota bacterium]